MMPFSREGSNLKTKLLLQSGSALDVHRFAQDIIQDERCSAHHAGILAMS
jgi:hypothetical protein